MAGADTWLIDVNLDTSGISQGLAGLRAALENFDEPTATSGSAGTAYINAGSVPLNTVGAAGARSSGDMRQIVAAQAETAALMQSQLVASSRMVGKQVRDLDRFSERYFDRLKTQIRGFDYFPAQQQAEVGRVFQEAFSRKSRELVSVLDNIRLADIGTDFVRRLESEARNISVNSTLVGTQTRSATVTGGVLPAGRTASDRLQRSLDASTAKTITALDAYSADLNRSGSGFKLLDRSQADAASGLRQYNELVRQTTTGQADVIRSQTEIAQANRYAAQAVRRRVDESYNQVVAVNLGTAPVASPAPRATTTPAASRASTVPTSRPVIQAAIIPPAGTPAGAQASSSSFVSASAINSNNRSQNNVYAPIVGAAAGSFRRDQRNTPPPSPVNAGVTAGPIAPAPARSLRAYADNTGVISAAELGLVSALEARTASVVANTEYMQASQARVAAAEAGLVAAINARTASMAGGAAAAGGLVAPRALNAPAPLSIGPGVPRFGPGAATAFPDLVASTLGATARRNAVETTGVVRPIYADAARGGMDGITFAIERSKQSAADYLGLNIPRDFKLEVDDFIAKRGREVVGTASYLRPQNVPGFTGGILDSMAISKNARGLGLGSSLASLILPMQETRYGGALPYVASSLSTFSAPIVSGVTGRSIGNSWGGEPGLSMEEMFAQGLISEAQAKVEAGKFRKRVPSRRELLDGYKARGAFAGAVDLETLITMGPEAGVMRFADAARGSKRPGPAQLPLDLLVGNGSEVRRRQVEGALRPSSVATSTGSVVSNPLSSAERDLVSQMMASMPQYADAARPTITQAQAQRLRALTSTANLAGMGPNETRFVTNVSRNMMASMPELTSRISTLQTNSPLTGLTPEDLLRSKALGMAASVPNRNRSDIAFSTSMSNAKIARSVASGFNTGAPNAGTVAAHEITHVIEHMGRPQLSGAKRSSSWGNPFQEVENLVQEYWGQYGSIVDEFLPRSQRGLPVARAAIIRDELSGYASKSFLQSGTFAEPIAEAGAQVWTGRASDLAKGLYAKAINLAGITPILTPGEVRRGAKVFVEPDVKPPPFADAMRPSIPSRPSKALQAVLNSDEFYNVQEQYARVAERLGDRDPAGWGRRVAEVAALDYVAQDSPTNRLAGYRDLKNRFMDTYTEQPGQPAYLSGQLPNFKAIADAGPEAWNRLRQGEWGDYVERYIALNTEGQPIRAVTASRRLGREVGDLIYNETLSKPINDPRRNRVQIQSQADLTGKALAEERALVDGLLGGPDTDPRRAAKNIPSLEWMGPSQMLEDSQVRSLVSGNIGGLSPLASVMRDAQTVTAAKFEEGPRRLLADFADDYVTELGRRENDLQYVRSPSEGRRRRSLSRAGLPLMTPDDIRQMSISMSDDAFARFNERRALQAIDRAPTATTSRRRGRKAPGPGQLSLLPPDDADLASLFATESRLAGELDFGAQAPADRGGARRFAETAVDIRRNVRQEVQSASRPRSLSQTPTPEVRGLLSPEMAKVFGADSITSIYEGIDKLREVAPAVFQSAMAQWEEFQANPQLQRNALDIWNAGGVGTGSPRGRLFSRTPGLENAFTGLIQPLQFTGGGLFGSMDQIAASGIGIGAGDLGTALRDSTGRYRALGISPENPTGLGVTGLVDPSLQGRVIHEIAHTGMGNQLVRRAMTRFVTEQGVGPNANRVSINPETGQLSGAASLFASTGAKRNMDELVAEAVTAVATGAKGPDSNVGRIAGEYERVSRMVNASPGLMAFKDAVAEGKIGDWGIKGLGAVTLDDDAFKTGVANAASWKDIQNIQLSSGRRLSANVVAAAKDMGPAMAREAGLATPTFTPQDARNLLESQTAASPIPPVQTLEDWERVSRTRQLLNSEFEAAAARTQAFGPAPSNLGLQGRLPRGAFGNAIVAAEREAELVARLENQLDRSADRRATGRRPSDVQYTKIQRAIAGNRLSELTANQRKALDRGYVPVREGLGRESEIWQLASRGDFKNAGQLRDVMRNEALQQFGPDVISQQAYRVAGLQAAIENGVYQSPRELAAVRRDINRTVSRLGLTDTDITVGSYQRLAESGAGNLLPVEGFDPQQVTRRNLPGYQKWLINQANAGQTPYGPLVEGDWIGAAAGGAGGGGYGGGFVGGAGGAMPPGGGGGGFGGGNYATGRPSRFTAFRQAVRGDDSLGGYFAGGALTSLRYALPSMLMFGAFAGITGALKEAEELKFALARLDSQLTQTFGEQAKGKIDQIKESIINLSKETGVGADELAKMEIAIRGAFLDATLEGAGGRTISGEELITEQREAAAKLAVVADLPTKLIGDELTAIGLSFGRSSEVVGNITTSLASESGVDVASQIEFLSSIAPIADQAGFSLEEISAIGATIAQTSGRTGGALAEQLGRVLPAVPGNKDALLQLAYRDPGFGPEFIDALREGDTADVFKALPAALPNITRQSEEQLYQLLGGRREAGVVIGAFVNPKNTKRFQERAEDSEGALDSRFERQKQTLTTQLRILGEQFRTIMVYALDAGLEDMFKLLIDSLKILVQVASPIAKMFTAINEALGGMPAKIIGAVAAWKLLQVGMHHGGMVLQRTNDIYRSNLGGGGLASSTVGGVAAVGPMAGMLAGGTRVGQFVDGRGIVQTANVGRFSPNTTNSIWRPTSFAEYRSNVTNGWLSGVQAWGLNPNMRGRQESVPQRASRAFSSARDFLTNVAFAGTTPAAPAPLSPLEQQRQMLVGAGFRPPFLENAETARRSAGEIRRARYAELRDDFRSRGLASPVSGGIGSRLAAGVTLVGEMLGGVREGYGERVTQAVASQQAARVAATERVRQGFAARFGQTAIGREYFRLRAPTSVEVPFSGMGAGPALQAEVPGATRGQALRGALAPTARGAVRASGAALAGLVGTLAANPFMGILALTTAYSFINGKLDEDAAALKKLSQETREGNAKALDLFNNGDESALKQRSEELRRQARTADSDRGTWDKFWRPLVGRESEGSVLRSQAVLASISPDIQNTLQDMSANPEISREVFFQTFGMEAAMSGAFQPGTGLRTGAAIAGSRGEVSKGAKGIRAEFESQDPTVQNEIRGAYDTARLRLRRRAKDDQKMFNFRADSLLEGKPTPKISDGLTKDEQTLKEVYARTMGIDVKDVTAEQIEVLSADDPQAELQRMIDEGAVTEEEAAQISVALKSAAKTAQDDPVLARRLREAKLGDMSRRERLDFDVNEANSRYQSGLTGTSGYIDEATTALNRMRSSMFSGTTAPSAEDMQAYATARREAEKNMSSALKNDVDRQLQIMEIFGASEGELTSSQVARYVDLLNNSNFDDPDQRLEAIRVIAEGRRRFFTNMFYSQGVNASTTSAFMNDDALNQAFDSAYTDQFMASDAMSQGVTAFDTVRQGSYSPAVTPYVSGLGARSGQGYAEDIMGDYLSDGSLSPTKLESLTGSFEATQAELEALQEDPEKNKDKIDMLKKHLGFLFALLQFVGETDIEWPSNLGDVPDTGEIMSPEEREKAKQAAARQAEATANEQRIDIETRRAVNAANRAGDPVAAAQAREDAARRRADEKRRQRQAEIDAGIDPNDTTISQYDIDVADADAEAADIETDQVQKDEAKRRRQAYTAARQAQLNYYGDFQGAAAEAVRAAQEAKNAAEVGSTEWLEADAQYWAAMGQQRQAMINAATRSARLAASATRNPMEAARQGRIAAERARDAQTGEARDEAQIEVNNAIRAEQDAARAVQRNRYSLDINSWAGRDSLREVQGQQMLNRLDLERAFADGDEAAVYQLLEQAQELQKALEDALVRRYQALQNLKKSKFIGDSLQTTNVDLETANKLLEVARQQGDPEAIANAEAERNRARIEQENAYQARVRALIELGGARAGIQEDPLAANDQEQRILQMELASARRTGQTDRAIELEMRLIDAQRNGAKLMQDVRMSMLELRQAELTAMEDEVGAAQVARQMAQEQLQDAMNRGAGEAEINRLRAQAITADKAAQDAVYTDRREEYQYMLDMGEISKSTYMAHIRQLQSTVIPGSKKFKELELELKRLRDDMSSDLSINMPSSLGLPTVYEIRRMNQQTSYNAGGSPVGYTDARQLNINGVAINNGMDFQQFVQVMAQFMGIPGTTGSAPRHY